MGLATDLKQSFKNGAKTLVDSFSTFFKTRKEAQLTKVASRDFEILYENRPDEMMELCYFSSFDRDSIVDDYVFLLLEAWNRAAIPVVFISTSARIEPCDLDRLKKLCAAVIVRKNLGYDFVSWKIGYKVLPPSPVTLRVYLVNDSVYGPLFPLDRVLNLIRTSPADLVGMTDSWESAYHLQSYFLAFQYRAVKTSFFRDWITELKVVRGKSAIVRTHEIGLTQKCLKCRLTTSALFPFRDIWPKAVGMTESENLRGRHFYNATYRFWKNLLVGFRYPFIKVSLLRESAEGLVGPRALEAVWAEIGTDYPLDRILEHQKRVSQGNIP